MARGLSNVSPEDTDQGEPLVTVVVTGWRNAPHLADCLRSLETSPPTVTWELVVSLNEPTPEVVSLLETGPPSARIVVSPVNRGFGGACNDAARLGRGRLLVLLNDDAEVTPGWLEALVDAAEAHPDAGAVGSRVLSAEGEIQEDGTVLWSDGSVTLIDRYHQPLPSSPPGVRRVDYCSGVSLLVRRQTWERVVGLDEGYFPAYYEDVDLCLKIQALGQEVLYEPASVVRHRHGASADNRYRMFLRDRNVLRLRARWGQALAERLPPAPDDPAAIARAVRAAADRKPRPGLGPTVPDEAHGADGDACRHYLQRELEITRQYAASILGELHRLEQAQDRRPVRWMAGRARELLRRVPGQRRLRRWLARWRSTAG